MAGFFVVAILSIFGNGGFLVLDWLANMLYSTTVWAFLYFVLKDNWLDGVNHKGFLYNLVLPWDHIDVKPLVFRISDSGGLLWVNTNHYEKQTCTVASAHCTLCTLCFLIR